MEHLNRIAKDAIGLLGSNMSEKAIQRIGRVMGTLSPVLDNFDCINNVVHTTSEQRKAKAQKDVMVVVSELNKARYFQQKTYHQENIPNSLVLRTF